MKKKKSNANELIFDISDMDISRDMNLANDLLRESDFIIHYVNTNPQIEDRKASELRIQSSKMLRDSERLKYTVAEKVYNTFPILKEKGLNLAFNRSYTKVKGCVDSEDAKQTLEDVEVDSKTGIPTSKLAGSGMLDINIDDSVEKIAFGDEKERKNVIKKMVESTVKVLPDRFKNVSKEQIETLAKDFIKERVTSFLKNNAKA